MRIVHRVWVWLVATLALLGAVDAGAQAPAAELPASAAGAGPVPLEAFFRNERVAAARLSPSGRWLALTWNPGDQRNLLVVMDLQGERKLSRVVRFDDADVDTFDWVSDDRLVFDLVQFQLGSGDQRIHSGLFSVRRDGSELRQLVRVSWQPPMTTGTHIATRMLGPDHGLLHVPARQTGEIVIGQFKFDARGNLDHVIPKRLDVTNGNTRLLEGEDWPAHGTDWLFDDDGEPRGVTEQRNGRYRIHWRGPGETRWRLLADFDRAHVDFEPAYVADGGRLFVLQPSGAGGTAEVKAFDFAKMKPADEPFVRVQGFDFLGAPVYDWIGGRLFGMRVISDAESTVWFDKSLEHLQALVDGRLPGRVNHISCRRCGAPDMVALIRSYSDRQPGEFWLYTAATSKLELLLAARPDIDPRRMATLDFHRIKARDGLELPLWVTSPPSTPGRDKPPAVLLVHGGPWVRGATWKWSGEAQFLASRGYVVIEPEFRGSRGYGTRHFRAGWRQWGQAMQDDLADAVDWAAAKGMIDPSRVCIMGASYGGYAALMGLVRHPQHYRCAVATVAVTDPRLMFDVSSWQSDTSDEAARYDLPTWIGDPERDAAMLAANAPVELAAKIKAPVLLAYGAMDRRVPLTHGERMRRALREAGNEPDWVLYPDEGHGWLLEANRIDHARRIERFLARHLAAPR